AQRSRRPELSQTCATNGAGPSEHNALLRCTTRGTSMRRTHEGPGGHMATRDPLADLQQMGQQYWQGLQDMGQQFLKQNPPPAAPWEQGMEQWRSLYQGADAGGVLGNLLSQGKTWMSTLEQLFKAGAGGTGADLS